MAASVVRDSITWPQGSISHETAQFGRFTDLDVMPRIAKNEASPNALRPVSRSPKNRPERGAGKNSGNCATSCVAKASFFLFFSFFPPQGGLPRRAARCSLKSGGWSAGKKVQACSLYYLSARYLLLSSRRPLTTSILASLAPMPIASNALFRNFYSPFHLFLSIFRDFQHTPPVLDLEFLGTGRVSRTGGFSRLPIRDLGDPAAWNRLKIVDSSEELCIPTFQSTAPSTKGMQSRSL